MPGRQAHGRPLVSKPKEKVSKKSRAKTWDNVLDAFGIAAAQIPESKRPPRGFEDVEAGQKHRRQSDDEGVEEKESEAPRRKKQRNQTEVDGSDHSNGEHGSDSEGNEWRLGGLAEGDEDSEIDSDNALGESDEERFQDFVFRGSKTVQQTKRKKRVWNPDTEGGGKEEEEEEEEDDDDDDDDSLGPDAIDLAQVLDQSDDGSTDADDQEESGSEGEAEDVTEPSSDDESDDDMAGDPDKLKRLKSLVTDFAGDDDEDADKEGAKGLSRRKIGLRDLGLFGVKDPHMRKSMKLMSREGKESRPGAAKKLDVPLAKRQQDRVLRSAAYEKTKDTLNRWTETVKLNRRAQHLVFPLPQNLPSNGLDSTELPALDVKNSTNELEQTIMGIMEQSGLSLTKAQADQKKQEEANAEAGQLSAVELQQMMNERRLKRELNTREARRAKRIKKIKSKAYHRVHRKERERGALAEREAMIESGELPSEGEREDLDRQRALERVGARHRESKWAKSGNRVKRAVWDDDYRTGLADMAQREKELLRRKEGRQTGSDEDDDDDEEEEEEEKEGLDDHSGPEGGSEDERKRLRRQIERLGEGGNDEPRSKLMGMKFMKRAEEALKQENDENLRQIRKDFGLDEDNEAEERGEHEGSKEGKDEDGGSESPAEIGRRKFGTLKEQPPGLAAPDSTSPSTLRRGRDRAKSLVGTKPASSENDAETAVGTAAPVEAGRKGDGHAWFRAEHKRQLAGETNDGRTGHAWAAAGGRRPRKSAAKAPEVDLDVLAFEQRPQASADPAVQASGKNKSKSKEGDGAEASDFSAASATGAPQGGSGRNDQNGADDTGDGDGDDAADDEHPADVHLPLAIRDQDLAARAFAGDDVAVAFEEEKARVAEDEDDKVVDYKLPGWGGWAGEGISKKRAGWKNPGRFTAVVEGVVRKADRKDARLKSVIINEKRVKKNDRYLASQLPHPFENRHQYERSLRVPVGPQWTTKESFQDATKPRVIVKPGVIEPIAKPVI